MIAAVAAIKTVPKHGLAATAIVLSVSSENWKPPASPFSNHCATQ